MATHAETRLLMQKAGFEQAGRAWVSMIDEARGVVLHRILPSKPWTRQVKWEDPAVVSAAGEEIFQRVEKAMRNLDAHGVVVLKEVPCRLEAGKRGKPTTLEYLPAPVPREAKPELLPDWAGKSCPVVLQPDAVVDYMVTEPTPIRKEEAELAAAIQEVLHVGKKQVTGVGESMAAVLGRSKPPTEREARWTARPASGFAELEKTVAATNGTGATVMDTREFVSVGAHDDIEWELVDNASNRGDIAQVSIVLGGNSAEIALNKRSRDILGTEYIRVHISKKGDAVALDPSDRSDFSAFKVAENGRFSAGVVVKKLGLSNVPGEMRTIRMEGLQDGKRLVAILPAILPD